MSYIGCKKIAVLCLLGLLSLTACTNVNPITPQSPSSSLTPTQTNPDLADYTVTYNYGDTGTVQLSANNIVLKVGQKVILQPAPGLTASTRFASSGDNFWGDIMQQQTAQQASTNAVFTAIKPGKGKLTIIPNNTETDRAIDLWATVQ